VPVPRLGPYSGPGDIRVVAMSTPDFQISQADIGDLLFFREQQGAAAACGTVPTNTTSDETAPTSMLSYNTSLGSGMFQVPALNSSVGTTRELKACFAPAGCDPTVASNYVELPDVLKVIPEPVEAVATSWLEADISELRFDLPLGHAAIEGDLVVLQQNNCSDVHQLTGNSLTNGFKNSAWCLLEDGGIAKNFRLAQSKLKELPAGTYKVCFATKSSEGWSQHDWKQLGMEIVITSTSDEPPPALEVPDAVALGADIVVIWNASTPLMYRDSEPGTWLGLYKSGDCDDGVGEGRHECFLASRSLPVGIPAGVVRFTQAEYKVAGAYDVRYMRGDMTNNQGRSCTGLTKSTAGTYLYCMFQAAAKSSTIEVFGRVEQHSDLSSVAGIEHIVLV